MQLESYSSSLGSACHWSFIARRGTQITLRDTAGGANVGMLFYNPYLLSESYNAPDTLKCQHTFKLNAGHCLYSDMGRIFCSITKDTFGWHDTVCGNSRAEHVSQRWGKRDYQQDRNLWMQNGYDSFLVELAKYALDRRSIGANVNLFSEVRSDEQGQLQLARRSQAGDEVVLRFEMDTLVLLHTCPHPMNNDEHYPRGAVEIYLEKAAPIEDDDLCLNSRPENRRGFQNNALYHFGL